jgi:hypothetical protein
MFDLILNFDVRVDIVNLWKLVILNWHILKFKSMIAEVMKD